jgi:stage V sporulation protein K
MGPLSFIKSTKTAFFKPNSIIDNEEENSVSKQKENTKEKTEASVLVAKNIDFSEPSPLPVVPLALAAAAFIAVCASAFFAVRYAIKNAGRTLKDGAEKLTSSRGLTSDNSSKTRPISNFDKLMSMRPPITNSPAVQVRSEVFQGLNDFAAALNSFPAKTLDAPKMPPPAPLQGTERANIDEAIESLPSDKKTKSQEPEQKVKAPEEVEAILPKSNIDKMIDSLPSAKDVQLLQLEQTVAALKRQKASDALKVAELEAKLDLVESSQEKAVEPDNAATQEVPRDAAPVMDAKALEKLIGITFEGLTGMDSVKDQLRDLAAMSMSAKKRGKKAYAPHIALSGPPGVGKSTMASKIGFFLKEAGLLGCGKVVPANRSDLVGPYIGQTEAKVAAKVAEVTADGGSILFIDEAYSLLQPGASTDYGKIALDQLLIALEEKRGQFTCIIAGYPEPLKNLLDSNPGLNSRFSLRVELQEMTVPDLREIALSIMRNEKLEITSEAQVKLSEEIQKRFDARGENWANAREMRMLVESIIKKQSRRIMNDGGDVFEVLPEDI